MESLWRFSPGRVSFFGEFSFMLLTFHEQRQEGCLENRLSPKCLVFSLALGSPSTMPVVTRVWRFSGSSSLKNMFVPSWKRWSRDGLVGASEQGWCLVGEETWTLHMQTFSQPLFSGPMPHPQLWRNLQSPWAQPLWVWWVLSYLPFLHYFVSPPKCVDSSHSLLFPVQFSVTCGFTSF